MIYPEATTEEWVEKWGLKVLPWTCPKCKGEFETTVPIYLRDMAGLETPIHDCGPGMSKVVLTPRTEEAKAFWNKVIS